MSELYKDYCVKSIEKSKPSEGEYQVRFYTLYREMKMIVISDKHPYGNYAASLNALRLFGLANHIVKTFQLNPLEVVWLEFVSPPSDSPYNVDFYLIDFDWQDGIPVNHQSLPIFEDWHLSWLKADLQDSALQQ